MRYKTKLLLLLMCVCLSIPMLWGCSDSNDKDSSKLNIVCTVYPQYNWVMNLLGNKASEYNVTLLVNNGKDLHSFQPSTSDIVNIKSCDLLIYVGGVSDIWIEDIIKDGTSKDMITINMLETIGDRALHTEIKEGMEADHEHVHVHDEDCDHHEEGELDEHVWLSLKNARVICQEITTTLCKLDSENSDSYTEAFFNYATELDDLDFEYSEVATKASKNTLIFGDRFPFLYMVKDYNIGYYAAFTGCSSDVEASFETIIHLAEKTDELGLGGICVTESPNKSLATTILENTKTKDLETYTFNSMQSVTAEQIESGIGYIQIMKDNLDALSKALN